MLTAQKKPFSRNDSILLPELGPVNPVTVRAHRDGARLRQYYRVIDFPE